jgi:hypothetical protein
LYIFVESGFGTHPLITIGFFPPPLDSSNDSRPLNVGVESSQAEPARGSARSGSSKFEPNLARLGTETCLESRLVARLGRLEARLERLASRPPDTRLPGIFVSIPFRPESWLLASLDNTVVGCHHRRPHRRRPLPPKKATDAGRHHRRRPTTLARHLQSRPHPSKCTRLLLQVPKMHAVARGYD